jgi:thiamine transport system permease protein
MEPVHRRTLKSFRTLIVVVFLIGTMLPFAYALIRLNYVTGWTLWQAIFEFPHVYGGLEALRFTFLEAFASSLLTVVIGLPIAWFLSRYQWKRIRLLRAFLAVPFVTPAIVAAMGFLSLIRQDGLLTKIGIDLRLEEGVIGWFAEVSGWQHPGHFIALIIAHAWFNLSLMIRFVEPTLSSLDPAWEEQLSMLPGGKSRVSRLKNLWIPVIGPAVLCAASLSFLFSFTSFALVKWLAPTSHTLESLMAEAGSSAGIVGYRIDSSELIYSVAILQFLVLLLTLWITALLQKRYSERLSLLSEQGVRKHHGPPSRLAKFVIGLGVFFTVLPFISVLFSSFQVRKITDGSVEYVWTLEGWRNAWGGDLSTMGVGEAMSNSIIYALCTLLVALPLGWILASTIFKLEQSGWSKSSKLLDLACMLPLAISALMVGLGVLLGGLRWYPEMFSWFLLPVYPHVLLTVPFVVRVMLPAYHSLDPAYTEQCQMLNLSPLRSWYHGTLMFLRGPAVVSGSLTLAFSLGEFGASWLLVRSGNWDTLSIVVDQLMSRPNFDPLIHPTAMAAATMLMMLTFFLFLFAERFRAHDQRSGF